MSLLPLIAIALVVHGLVVLVMALVMPASASRSQQRMEAIAAYVPGQHAGDHRASAQSGQSPVATLIEVSERVARSRKSADRTSALLVRADISLTPGEWLAAHVGVGVTLVVLTVLFSGNLFLVLLAVVVAIFVPPVVLKFLAKRRSNKFEKQLPDVLMLIATSLGSGFGLTQAFDAVVQDAAEPVAKEFARAQAETRLGGQLVNALERVAERMDSTTLTWTVMAMRIQAEVGGNLAETLRTTANTLRERERLLGQVRALSAEGRLSGWVLAAMPIGLFLYLLMVNRPYVSLLWTRGLGIGMMAGGLISMAVGIFWMNKLVKIEV